jgi:hypothetical protein
MCDQPPTTFDTRSDRTLARRQSGVH